MATYDLPEKIDSEIDHLERLITDFKDNKISSGELKAYRVPFGVYEQRKSDTFMLRLRCPGGCLLPRQLSVVADLAKKYSNGTLHITTRQELQIHYVSLDNIIPLMRELRKHDLASRGGGGNTVRNILADQGAGVDPHEVFDITPHVLELTNRLIQEDDSWTLPRKLKIAFSGSQKDRGLATVADLGFIAQEREGKRGFKVYVAGGFGSKAQEGKLYHSFLPEEQVYQFAQAVKLLFWKLGNRKNKHSARLRYLWRSMGEESFRHALDSEFQSVKEQGHGAFHVEELIPELSDIKLDHKKVDDSFGIWRSRFVIPQKQSGLNQVYLPVELGFIGADEIGKLAQLLEPLGDDVFRFTIDQNILLRNIADHQLPGLYEKLRGLFETFNRPLILDRIVACAGASTCKLGFCLSREGAKAIGEKLESSDLELDRLNHLRINMSGCPNSCGQHPIADIGFYGRAGRKKGHLFPQYKVVIGAVIEDEKTQYAQPVGDINARDLPVFLEDLLAHYLGNFKESFKEYLRNGGDQFIQGLLDKYKEIPSFEEDKNYYFDWGASEVFSLEGRSQGECSAGLFDLIDVDIAEMKKRLLLLDKTSEEISALEVIGQLVFHASRTLLITRGFQPQTSLESLNLFKDHFIASSIVPQTFAGLIDKAIEGRLDLTDRGSAIALSRTIEDLYAGMDNSFQFKTQKSDSHGAAKSPKQTEAQGWFKDLRGVACPMNFVKTKMELSKMKSGEVLEVWLDDGEPINNVPGSVKNEGHKVLSQELREEYWSVVIKKKD